VSAAKIQRHVSANLGNVGQVGTMLFLLLHGRLYNTYKPISIQSNRCKLAPLPLLAELDVVGSDTRRGKTGPDSRLQHKRGNHGSAFQPRQLASYPSFPQ